MVALALLSVSAASQKQMTDAQSENLKGKVQEVVNERAGLELKDGKWNALNRRVSSITTYGAQGNRLTVKFYDDRGNLSTTISYFEIDGLRAMSRQFIRQSYDPPPMAAPPQAASAPSDPRYDIKHIDKYDDHGRRSEVLMIGNDGKVTSLLVSKFDEKIHQTESEQWSRMDELQRMYGMSDSTRKLDKLPRRFVEVDNRKIEMGLNSRSVYRYGEQDNLIESFSLDDSGVPKYHTQYEQYEFDANGNWTKRTRFRVAFKDWKQVLTPEAIEYQAIKYHP